MFAIGRDDSVWVELDSGSIVAIAAPADVLDLLEAGASVLVDLDSSGTAVPWSTVVVTRSEPAAPRRASSGPKPVPVAGQPHLRELDDAGVRRGTADHPRAGMVPA
jgi:hypothetical protein